MCPHFHLALQSGSDAVLGRMGRRYNVAEYEAALRLIKDGVPDAAVTTDVMVGFPGESDGEFRDSLSLCRRMGFARMHVFAYSPRPGTRAASMPDKVEDKVKKARSKEMLALAADGASVFREGFLGGQMTVLFEEGRGGVWSGLAGNYIRVYVPSAEDLTNKLLLVRLKRVHGDGVWGEIEP